METMTVAKFLTQRIALCGKSQKTIAKECGYPNSNIVTMFKQGTTKLPLDKVQTMARALDADPRYLLRLVMMEYQPQAWAVIVQMMGAGVSVTEDEARLLELVHEAGHGRNPNLDSRENFDELSAVIARIVARDDSRDSAAVARLEMMPKNRRQG
jgi:hypothetical protein